MDSKQIEHCKFSCGRLVIISTSTADGNNRNSGGRAREQAHSSRGGVKGNDDQLDDESMDEFASVDDDSRVPC
jgi:hypothetical protein